MKAIEFEAGAAIYDQDRDQLLPLRIHSLALAVAFLEAAERSGANLYVGMPHSDMRQLYGIWYDAWKRSWPDEVVQHLVA